MNIGKTRKEVIDKLLDFILFSIFDPIPGEIISEKVFFATIKDIENRGLYATGQKICDQLMAIVRKRRTAQENIGKMFSKKANKFLFPAGQKADFDAHLHDIFPFDLISSNDPVDLQNIDRQLKSLIIRLERFHANPGKDSQKAAQLEPYLHNLHQLMEKRDELSGEAREQVFRFRDLINEYRISLFSPEIKTRESISPKRLDQQWRLTLSKC